MRNTNWTCRTILSKTLPFVSLVIIDPFLFPGSSEDLANVRKRLVDAALRRRNLWRTREEAREYLKKRNWDNEILDLYVVSLCVVDMLRKLSECSDIA